MSVAEYCNREVVVIERGESIAATAALMRRHHVGDLVVVERRGEDTVPVGLVTDRDIVIEVVAAGVALDAVTVGDIMSSDIHIARETDELWATLERMRSLGVRRLPVVDEQRALVGILTLDDVLELLAEGLTDLVKLVRRELADEAERRH